MARTGIYKDSKVTEFPYMHTNPGTKSIDVPAIVSKYWYVDDEYESDFGEGDYEESEDDDEEVEDDELHARKMTILDMVVHLEEIQSQLEKVIGMHKSFRELNEDWLESNAKFVTKSDDRVSWILNETRKKNALDKMGKSLEQIQDEMATLSLKSKDLYREHSLQQKSREQHHRIRRSKKAQQKKREEQQLYLHHQQQQYFNTPTPITPITSSIIWRSKPMGFPSPPRPSTMQQRIQTQ
mmetsp:Transcript_67567/g.93974  ORF Transcript_67567/g.93974 Transcript_67567/m.93974 type:complete len:239 (+) Transcript_67567:81-797(+)